jgi:hypothetical protein
MVFGVYYSRTLLRYSPLGERHISLRTMLLSSETTAKGTGLEKSAGKEDPVELDSSQTL